MKKVLFYLGISMLAAGFTACNNNNPEEHNGELTGVFSVSETQKVIFSKGNLQYLPTSKIWEFNTYEYACQASGNDKITADHDSWIDLFVWGAQDPLRQEFVDDDFATFYDWGNNRIQNGGNKAKMWRTLSTEEWTYLYDGRENAKKLRGFATISTDHADYIGYVFLPDDWALPRTAFMADGNPEANVFTVEDWQEMSEAGAVFLRAAGYNYADEEAVTDYVNISGYYWSSTPYEGELGDCHALYFYYNDGYQSVSPDNVAHGTDRYSVRLVKNVK